MNDTERSRLDPLIDLLADEVARRLQARAKKEQVTPEREPATRAAPPAVSVPVAIEATPSPESQLMPPELPETPTESAPIVSAPAPLPVAPIVSPPAPLHAASLMARLAFGVFIIVVLINIPFNSQGNAIARSIPSSASLVIADGLVVKESTSPDIWVYRDGAFHWITSLDAFDYFGYRWQDVHVVEPGFLSQFDKGNPIYVLLKCDSSPHIYQLAAGRKRWIVDIPTFTAQGYVWEDVKIVPCYYLHNLPDGDSIPPGRGTPPPPLP